MIIIGFAIRHDNVQQNAMVDELQRRSAINQGKPIKETYACSLTPFCTYSRRNIDLLQSNLLPLPHPFFSLHWLIKCCCCDAGYDGDIAYFLPEPRDSPDELHTHCSTQQQTFGKVCWLN